MTKGTITLSNPDLLELASACRLHVPGFTEYANTPFAATSYLSQIPHLISFDPDREPNRYVIELKCKGHGCKSREVIGSGEAETLEKAAMIALLDMNKVKVVYR